MNTTYTLKVYHSIHSTLSFKKHSGYSLQSFLDLHQKKDIKIILKMNYGKNFKNKMLTLGAQFPKSIENLKKPKVYGMMNLHVPEKVSCIQCDLTECPTLIKLTFFFLFFLLSAFPHFWDRHRSSFCYKLCVMVRQRFYTACLS